MLNKIKENACSFLIIEDNFIDCNIENINIYSINIEFKEQLLTGEAFDFNLFTNKEKIHYHEINKWSDFLIKILLKN